MGRNGRVGSVPRAGGWVQQTQIIRECALGMHQIQ